MHHSDQVWSSYEGNDVGYWLDGSCDKELWLDYDYDYRLMLKREHFANKQNNTYLQYLQRHEPLSTREKVLHISSFFMISRRCPKLRLG